MDKFLLPIGTVIELNNNEKLIIIGYEIFYSEKLSYLAAGYPTYYIEDLIPSSKIKEFEDKYNFHNVDQILPLDTEYKIIHMGYKDANYEEFANKIKNLA